MVEEFRVGIITSPHGLHGEVKVYPTTDDPRRFSRLKEIRLVDGRGNREILKIRSVKYFKNQVILGFEGIDRIEDTERLRKKELYIDRKDAMPLEEGEYYIPDLIGMTVTDDTGEVLGELKDVLFTGANRVYSVKMENGKDLLIPAIPDCILSIDPEAGRMEVHLLPGLRDL